MRRKFNPQLHEWLVKNSKDYTAKELVVKAKELFNEDFTLKQMQQYFWHHDNIQYKYEQKNKSHSNKALPIGSERIKSDGMHQIKVGPRKWVYKQRKIYEEYYNVKLKDDEYVIFLDQDRNNFSIDNLKVISRRTSAIMANEKLFFKNKDLTATGVVLAETIIKTKEVLESD